MKATALHPVEKTKKAALEVLLHNMKGPYQGLPRTAGWGYPEPYTRDLMIAGLGILVSGNEELIDSLGRVLETLAENQSRLGHIPSLVHDPDDRGASDTTPLFLMMLGMYRRHVDRPDFLEEAAQKALIWMDYQSPDDRVMIAQLPTTDWRDEQEVMGYGLFVNTIAHAYLRLFNKKEKAKKLHKLMSRFTVTAEVKNRHVHEGLVVAHKPYYAAWSFKIHESERVDLLGNSLAVLSGVASPSRADSLVGWIERECDVLRSEGRLAVDLPPNFFPYVRPEDPDWRPRYAKYNRPGEYHNGGIWPFICGFYVSAIVASGKQKLAENRLEALTRLVKPARVAKVDYGFNEWVRAQDGVVCGQDWQTWSAAMYLYAAACVERGCTPFFDEIQQQTQARKNNKKTVGAKS